MGIMGNVGLTAAPGIRCRPIEDGDAQAIVALLARGFAPRRTPQFWQDVIACLARRTLPAEAPRYGWLLESNRAPVGALLQIFSHMPAGDGGGSKEPELRCSVSSWYVEPDFRSYAPLLVRQALKRRDVTYLNTSPAPHTRPIAEAQGYARYNNGAFVAVALLSRHPVFRPIVIATESATWWAWGLVVVGGVLDAAGLISLSIGLDGAPTWLVGLASSFGPAVTILAAVALLGERLRPVQWVGLAGIAVGLVAIALP